MVCGRNLEHSVADMLEGHLLDDVSVELFIATLMVLRRHWERRVDAIRRELCDSLLGADSWEFFAVDSSDSKHLLLLEAELFILAFVLSRVLLRGVIELDDRYALFSVESHLFFEIFWIQVHDGRFDWIVHGLGSCLLAKKTKTKHACHHS